MSSNVMFTKTRDVKTPTRGTSVSAGLDFYVPNDCLAFNIKPGESVNIPSGIKMILPKGFAGVLFNKSGVGIKGLLTGACVIDEDYRGEVHLNIHNVSKSEVTFQPGQKLTQMLIIPISLLNPLEISNYEYSQYDTTDRKGGFGSTGIF